MARKKQLPDSLFDLGFPLHSRVAAEAMDGMVAARLDNHAVRLNKVHQYIQRELEILANSHMDRFARVADPFTPELDQIIGRQNVRNIAVQGAIDRDLIPLTQSHAQILGIQPVPPPVIPTGGYTLWVNTPRITGGPHPGPGGAIDCQCLPYGQTGPPGYIPQGTNPTLAGCQAEASLWCPGGSLPPTPQPPGGGNGQPIPAPPTAPTCQQCCCCPCQCDHQKNGKPKPEPPAPPEPPAEPPTFPEPITLQPVSSCEDKVSWLDRLDEIGDAMAQLGNQVRTENKISPSVVYSLVDAIVASGTNTQPGSTISAEIKTILSGVIDKIDLGMISSAWIASLDCICAGNTDRLLDLAAAKAVLTAVSELVSGAGKAESLASGRGGGLGISLSI
jgi:hypothetical protein